MQWVRLQFHWAIIDFIRHMRASMEKRKGEKSAPLCVCVLVYGGGGDPLSLLTLSPQCGYNLKLSAAACPAPGVQGVLRGHAAPRRFPSRKKPFTRRARPQRGDDATAQVCLRGEGERGGELISQHAQHKYVTVPERKITKKLIISLSHTHGAREFVH